MGFTCAVIGCSHKQGRDSQYSYHKLPRVVIDQGEAHKELTIRRQRAWLANLCRSDIKNKDNVRVCSEHFVSGK